MQDLVKQEQFEIEVLDRLKSGKFLDSLIFTGGTMLRLCYGLNRFSIDLDFWFYREVDIERYFSRLKEFFLRHYSVRDAENKFYTMLFEIKSKDYPRTLKIEIRKKIEKVKTEFSIAYSKYSNIQVLVRTLSLEEVMKSKIEAFLSRREIRDVFDIEFLLKKGIEIHAKKEDLLGLLKGIEAFSKSDYSVKLGSILDLEWRRYYMKENFKILVRKIREILEEK
ncbi:MAG: nucleotidyl transferase AbiEii/AbiGii toxin family protein [Thermodesulfovibrio sp.]|nr:nucleotidyl transferase AbiEii/AbiGii toxin family protein [Thermodesulfovibrio sp.]